MSQYWCVSLRSGVMLSVISRNVSVQVPVEKVMTWMGLAPSAEFSAFQPSRASGSRHTRKTSGLKYLTFTLLRNSSSGPCPLYSDATWSP